VTVEHFVLATRERTDAQPDTQATQNPAAQGATRSDNDLSKVTQEDRGKEDACVSVNNPRNLEEQPLSLPTIMRAPHRFLTHQPQQYQQKAVVK
ncbi:MAG: hypothetical protein RMJ88_10945, partial [Thermogemmata sp.]|nr:hypothetical protein [Thermogemmata sp.]